MPLPPFSSWLQRRQIKPLEADRLLPIIANAGSRGISRGELGRAIKLDRDVLDELLVGLVAAHFLTVVDQGGLRVYRATHSSVIGP